MMDYIQDTMCRRYRGTKDDDEKDMPWDQPGAELVCVHSLFTPKANVEPKTDNSTVEPVVSNGIGNAFDLSIARSTDVLTDYREIKRFKKSIAARK